MFGGTMPGTLMVPFADTINHHNVDSGYDIIKAEWKPMPLEENLRRYPDRIMSKEEKLAKQK